MKYIVVITFVNEDIRCDTNDIIKTSFCYINSLTSSGTIPLEEDEASDFRSFAGGEVKKLLGMPGKAD